jgi:hypothetical protein
MFFFRTTQNHILLARFLHSRNLDRPYSGRPAVPSRNILFARRICRSHRPQYWLHCCISSSLYVILCNWSDRHQVGISGVSLFSYDDTVPICSGLGSLFAVLKNWRDRFSPRSTIERPISDPAVCSPSDPIYPP